MMSGFYDYFTHGVSSLASHVGQDVSGIASAVSSAAPHVMRLAGTATGIYSMYSGARQMYDNSGAGGTWGGLAHGAVQFAGGAAAMATAHTTGTIRAAATAVQTGATFVNSFATASRDPAATQTSTLTGMAHGGVNAMRAPLEAVSAATGSPAIQQAASYAQRIATVTSVTHNAVTHGPRVQRVAAAVRGAL